MDLQGLIDQFSGLTIWKAGGERAPHKPLLVLLALARLQQEDRRLLPFTEIEPELKKLLEDFGPARRSYKAEYPFYYLQNDGIWELEIGSQIQLPLDRKIPSAAVFRDWQFQGGFPPAVYALLKDDPEAIREIAQRLLSAHFPDTLHEDILQAVGLDLEGIATAGASPGTHIRDPKFRHEVLTAYGYRCAVCGLKIEMQDKTVAIEAAHIKWHQAGGPDQIANGLALCTLHHKLFDVGAFTLTDDLMVSVSSMAHGNEGFRRWLLEFNGTMIDGPAMPDLTPENNFLRWHVSEVFKGRGRYALDLE